jgi:hypothetical protein
MNILKNDFVPRTKECEWPMSEDRNGVTFCCDKPSEGSSYCEKHHRLAYFYPDNATIDITDVDTRTVEIDEMESE